MVSLDRPDTGESQKKYFAPPLLHDFRGEEMSSVRSGGAGVKILTLFFKTFIFIPEFSERLHQDIDRKLC